MRYCLLLSSVSTKFDALKSLAVSSCLERFELNPKTVKCQPIYVPIIYYSYSCNEYIVHILGKKHIWEILNVRWMDPFFSKVSQKPCFNTLFIFFYIREHCKLCIGYMNDLNVVYLLTIDSHIIYYRKYT